MAPEILKYIDFTKKLSRQNKKDKIEYDFNIDVYSFGCVLYEIMSSKELYQDLKTGKDVQQFVLSKKREKIPNIAINTLNIPNSYCKLMNQCMNHNPKKRPNFKDIILRLQNIAKNIKLNKKKNNKQQNSTTTTIKTQKLT